MHHFFAVDALCEVLTDDGQRMVNMLLANYQRYLQGAKAPDNKFKDFENHVVHVSDGYWGGAARTANLWLTKIYQLLQQQDWSEASYAMGVLSHYVTDPFMPLHTGQSPRETTFHRPLEWSVCCAYRDLYDAACNHGELSTFEIPDGEHWLTDTIHLGARLAHQYYDDLMNDYDLAESRRYPASALGARSKSILMQLISWSVTAWGNIIERISALSNQDIPAMSLALPTILAASQTPAKKLTQAIESNQHRLEIERMLEEYHRTGQVTKNVPLEQRIVKKIRLEQPNLKPPVSEVFRAEQIDAPKPPKKQPAAARTTSNDYEAQTLAKSYRQDQRSFQPVVTAPDMQLDSNLHSAEQENPDGPTSEIHVDDRQQSNGSHEKEVREQMPVSKERGLVTLASPIVDAPSIGPKTASRFLQIGIETIGEFLDQNPEELAAALNTKWITPKLVAQWQSQTKLSTGVERLSAAGAGLLVMLGIESVTVLADCDPTYLQDELSKISKTNEGQRLLRDKGPPPLKTVQRWIESAKNSLSRA